MKKHNISIQKILQKKGFKKVEIQAIEELMKKRTAELKTKNHKAWKNPFPEELINW